MQLNYLNTICVKMGKINKHKAGTGASLFVNTIGILCILVISGVGFFLFNQIDVMGLNIEPEGPKKKIKTLGENAGEKKEFSKNTVTVLLVARGGYQNDAPHLTDTIMLAKLNFAKRSVSLLSIPRDLYVLFPKGYKPGKINALYQVDYYKEWNKIRTKARKNGIQEPDYSEAQKAGMDLLQEKITEITGENIDFYANVDIQGFVSIIDAIGGIDVDVPRSFTDREYPDNNWGWKVVSFKKGLQHLDGTRTLEYARSRHATGGYDRDLRQQLVIQGIKEKVINSNLVGNPEKINELYNLFYQSVYTNISIKDALPIILKLAQVEKEGDLKFHSSNFNPSCANIVTCQKGSILGETMLNRDTDNKMSINYIIGTKLYNPTNYEYSKKFSDIALNYSDMFDEKAQVTVFNGTGINGLAHNLIKQMKRYGFTFPEKDYSGNAPEKVEKSVIYYNNINKESDTYRLLEYFFTDGEMIEVDIPKYSKDPSTKFEIILGTDYYKDRKIFNF